MLGLIFRKFCQHFFGRKFKTEIALANAPKDSAGGRTFSTSGRRSRVDLMPASSSSSSSSSDSEDANAARFASVAVDGEAISTGAAAAAEASRQRAAAALEHRRNR